MPRREEPSASVSSAWRRGLVGVAVAGQDRRGRLAQDARALADVDPGEVEAEDVDLPQQPPDRAERDVPRAEVGEHELEIAAQRLRVGVARLAPARAQRVDEPVVDEAELGPQRLPLAVRAPQDLRRTAAPARRPRATRRSSSETGIRSEECENICASRSTRTRKSCSAVPAVQLQRARERVGADLRVAVHVAAGPAAVGEHGLHEPDVERVLDLAQHLRHGVEQHGLEEEQVAPHLVLDARADAAQLVGLPPDGQDLAQLVQQPAPARRAECAGRRGGRAAPRRPTDGRAPSAAWPRSGARSARARSAAGRPAARCRRCCGAGSRPSRPATRAGSRRSRRTGAGGGPARAPRRCWRAGARASRRG